MSSAPSHAGHEVHKDYLGSKMAMWLFLFTEIILFGGLFVLYAAYRSMYAHAFEDASHHLNVTLGVTNTVVLLTSSLTVALATTAMQRGDRAKTLLFVGATVVLALVLLVNKYFEWSAKIEHGLYPGGAELVTKARGEQIFFGLYYAMTGLHGLHVIIGAVLLATMWCMVRKGTITKDNSGVLENGGLYWHVVDVIWIFLLPFFYLAA